MDNLIQGLIPGNAFELLAAFRTGTAHGIQNPIRVIVPLFVILQLHAQAATGGGMILIAVHADEFFAFDLEDHGTGIRTIVRTAAEEGFSFGFQLCGHATPP
jgi:hypothetical protein